MQARRDGSRRLTWIRSYNSPNSTCPTTPSQCLTSFTYDYASPQGLDTTTRYAVTERDGRKTAYTYDDVTRLTRARVTSSSGAELEDYECAYDGRGNMLSETVTGSAVANESVNYDYNAASELTCAHTGATCDTGAASTTTFTYDPNGNLAAADPGGVATGTTFDYNLKNQTSAITPPGQAAIAMVYQDATSDLRVAVGDERMNYSQLGLMSQAPTPGIAHPTWFVRDDDGVLVSMVDRTDPNQDQYYVFDGLGSVVATTGESGNIVRRYRVGAENSIAFMPHARTRGSGHREHRARSRMPEERQMSSNSQRGSWAAVWAPREVDSCLQSPPTADQCLRRLSTRFGHGHQTLTMRHKAENSVRDAAVRPTRVAATNPGHWPGCTTLMRLLGRVWVAREPKTFKADHNRSKTFAQLIATNQHGSKILETARTDLSRR
jgi:hypothetical protein